MHEYNMFNRPCDLELDYIISHEIAVKFYRKKHELS